jgi:hypothetical protein
MVSFFQPWGQIQGHNVQHLLLTWGRLKSVFSLSALTPGVKRALSTRGLSQIWLEVREDLLPIFYVHEETYFLHMVISNIPCDFFPPTKTKVFVQVGLAFSC